MKHNIYAYLRALGMYALLAVAPLAGAQTPAPTAPTAPTASAAPEAPVDNSPEHISYLFGLTFGEQLHSVGISSQVDQAAIARGIQDGLQGKKSVRADQQQIQGFVRTVMAETLTHNKQAAKDFLEKNG
ncbi:MAG: FKBP-type peptidyl-prolyl cis-trans isomerase N-terminal domain-containing protein, partial [Steroidobacteraceae bacterium]